MTPITVIDWDSQQLRTVVGIVGRRGLREARCSAVPWDAAEQQGLTAGSFAAVVKLLEDATEVRGRGILMARRTHLEGLTLAAPPTTNDELPALVDNRLTTELGMGDDDAVHDYLTLDEDVSLPRHVVITAMDGAVAAEYRQLATQLKLSRARLIVRACGAAALAQRSAGDPTASTDDTRASTDDTAASTDDTTLLVVPNVEELDLAIVDRGRLAYWRSIYSSPAGDSESFRGFVADELVRTLAVAEESLPEGRRVERVEVFLSEDEDRGIEKALREAVDLPVSSRRPELPGVEVTYQGEAGAPGRFAPLLGALAEEADGKRPAVDLFTRQTPPRPQTSRRPLLLGVLALLTAISLGSYVLWEEVAEQTSAANRLATELKGLKAGLKERKADAESWEAIQAWNEANIVWLDELRDLSVRFPPPGTALVLDFSASPNAAGGASIRLSGKARDPAVVTDLDGELRDESRSVLSRNLRQQTVSADDPFVWRFESLITTRRRSASDYREALRLQTSSDLGLPLPGEELTP